MESIHKRIKRLREKSGMTQSDLATVAGVKYQSVQEWERENGTAPARKRQAAVAAALKVTVQELMTGVPDAREARIETQQGEDPRVKKIAAEFYWLTEEQKRDLAAQVHAMAIANRAITKQLRSKLDPVPDAYVEKHIKPIKRASSHHRSK